MAAASSMGGGSGVVVLVSSDGHEFEASQAAASLSEIIRVAVRAEGTNRITLHNVAARPLAKVLEYCNMHAAGANNSDDHETNSSSSAAAAKEEDLKSLDAQFIDVGQAMLYDLFMAANYLEIEGLLDLCSKRFGDMIKGKTPDQIRGTFGIKNDFTADEEAEIRRENPWLFGNE